MVKWICVLPVLLSACGQTYGGVPGGDDHGYLLIASKSEDKGWAVVGAIQHGLPPNESVKVRTAGVVRGGAAMFIDFNGDCTRDQAFVERMRRIAVASGTPQVRCSPTPPAT